MKKRLSFYLTLILTFAFFSVSVIAQDDNNDTKPTQNPDGTYSTTEFDEAERPEDSYLAKSHAQEVVERLMKTNLEQIYLLKVINSNFSDKGYDDEYKKAYDGYKKGLSLYYQRNRIYSRHELEKNKEVISTLLKRISDDYRKDTAELLDQCAEQIMMLHLDATTRSDPNKNDELYKNQMRLRIAYGQFDDAERAIVEHKPDTAIFHFRVAKSYGIKILEDLSNPDERDAVKEKYKVHKADNLNRIYEKAGQSGGGGEQPAQ